MRLHALAPALLASALVARFSQAADPPENMLVADLGLHVIGAGFQRTVSPVVSLQVDADFYDPWTQNQDVLGLGLANGFHGDLIGAALRARAFFYPLGSAPSGLWISPFAQQGIGWATRNGEKRTGTVTAAGASVGYAFLVGQRVLIAIGFGAQYHAATIPGGDGPPSFGRLYPHGDVIVGYAF
jgi:hypothetical protein